MKLKDLIPEMIPPEAKELTPFLLLLYQELGVNLEMDISENPDQSDIEAFCETARKIEALNKRSDLFRNYAESIGRIFGAWENL